MPTLPRLIITRPEPQASHWAAALRAQGLHTVDLLPTMHIELAAHRSGVQAAWMQLASSTHPPAIVLFVSPSAVMAMFDGAPMPWPAAVEAATPGPGTASALGHHGVARVVAPAADAPSFDSEALWALLHTRSWSGRRVLILHGGAGRDWLESAWLAQGAQVHKLQVYARIPAVWTPAQQQVAQQALQPASSPGAEALWLFSASAGVRMLDESLPCTGRWALCTHQAIADVASARGFVVQGICQPQPLAIAQAARAIWGRAQAF